MRSCVWTLQNDILLYALWLRISTNMTPEQKVNASKTKNSKAMPTRPNASISAASNDIIVNHPESGTEVVALVTLMLEQQNRAIDQFKITFDLKLIRSEESLQRKIDVLTGDLFKCQTDLDTALNRATDSDRRAEYAEAKVTNLETKLETANTNLDDLEMSLRRTYIVVNNLPEKENKSDEDVFLALCEKELKLTGDMKVTKEQLYSVTRARGKQNDPIQSNRPRSTIIRFQNEKYRNIVFKKKKDLKGKGIVLTEFLTTRCSQLLKECIAKIPSDFTTRSYGQTQASF